MPRTMPGLPLSVLLIIIGLALIGSVLVRIIGGGITTGSPRTQDPRPQDAMGILEQRLARGEIDTEEYHRRRRTLEEGR